MERPLAAAGRGHLPRTAGAGVGRWARCYAPPTVLHALQTASSIRPGSAIGRIEVARGGGVAWRALSRPRLRVQPREERRRRAQVLSLRLSNPHSLVKFGVTGETVPKPATVSPVTAPLREAESGASLARTSGGVHPQPCLACGPRHGGAHRKRRRSNMVLSC